MVSGPYEKVTDMVYKGIEITKKIKETVGPKLKVGWCRLTPGLTALGVSA